MLAAVDVLVTGGGLCLQVWSTKSVEGVHRFLARSYRLVTGSNVADVEPTKDQLRLLHATIKRVWLLEEHIAGCNDFSFAVLVSSDRNAVALHELFLALLHR